MKCDACGSESDFDAGFIKQPEALGGPAKNFCAVCWVKRSNLRRAWFLPMLMVAAAFGYAEDKVALYGSESGRLLMNIAVIGLFTVLTIIPHELGHAMMGRAVGWRVQQVVIGVGKSLFKRRWVGILFDFRVLPLAGATWVMPSDVKRYRLKKFLVILAGPAVNAGLAAGVLLLMFVLRGSGSYFDFESIPTWARLFFIANVFVLVINLWPHQPVSGFDLPTDGKQLLQLISFNKTTMAKVQAQQYALEAFICRDQGDLGRARELCDRGLASVPDEVNLLNLSAIVCLDEARYEQAREVFLTLLKKEKQPPAMKFALLNNLAYADVLSERADLLPEADLYSRDAYAGLPWMACIAGTRGAVLAAMGQYEEGIALLRQAMDEVETPRAKADNACHIAKALARIDQKSEAEKYIQLARQLDAKCPLIARAEKAVAM